MTTFCFHDSEAVTLSPGDWAALTRISGVLEVFRQATLQLSARGPNLDLVLVTYKTLLTTLKSSKGLQINVEGRPSLWAKSIDVCLKKLQKYIDRSIQNDYVCMALSK